MPSRHKPRVSMSVSSGDLREWASITDQREGGRADVRRSVAMKPTGQVSRWLVRLNVPLMSLPPSILWLIMAVVKRGHLGRWRVVPLRWCGQGQCQLGYSVPIRDGVTSRDEYGRDDGQRRRSLRACTIWPTNPSDRSHKSSEKGA